MISIVVTPSAISASSRGSALRDERILARGARRLHGRDDAAAGSRHLLIARARKAQLEFMGAVAGINEMGVAIDEPGRDPAPFAIRALDGLESGGARRRARIDDAALAFGDEAVLDRAEARFVGTKRRETGIVPKPIYPHRHGRGPLLACRQLDGFDLAEGSSFVYT